MEHYAKLIVFLIIVSTIFLGLFLSLIHERILWAIHRSNLFRHWESASTRAVPSIMSTSSSEDVKAVILVLCRNSDKDQMEKVLETFENRFNKKFKYPYVFLNDQIFDDDFEQAMVKIVNEGSQTEVRFGLVPKEHWSCPSWINEDLASQSRKHYVEFGTPYGGSQSYRLMCRYFSGFFHKHPLLQQYEYYWRVEPDADFQSNIDYDVFKFMRDNKKIYGFTIITREHYETVPTLWEAVLSSQHERIRQLPSGSLLEYFGNPSGPNGYNGCHFWSNFEIASFSLFRSQQYQDYFDALDKAGGFFYERWGDAPVHSIAVGLFLHPEQVHYFSDIAYYHPPSTNCPLDCATNLAKNCTCIRVRDWDDPYTRCFIRWWRLYDPSQLGPISGNQ